MHNIFHDLEFQHNFTEIILICCFYTNLKAFFSSLHFKMGSLIFQHAGSVPCGPAPGDGPRVRAGNVGVWIWSASWYDQFFGQN